MVDVKLQLLAVVNHLAENNQATKTFVKSCNFYYFLKNFYILLVLSNVCANLFSCKESGNLFAAAGFVSACKRKENFSMVENTCLKTISILKQGPDFDN